MTCSRIEELLSAYLEGELDASERDLIEGHVASCESCAGLLSAMRETLEALSGFPEVEPGPELLGRLYAMPRRKRGLRLIVAALLKPSLQPVYATAAVILIAFTFLTASPEGRSFQKSFSRRLHSGYSRIEKIYVKAGSIKDELSVYANDLLGSLKSLPLLGKSEEKNTSHGG